jgi:hypothetical protein
MTLEELAPLTTIDGLAAAINGVPNGYWKAHFQAQLVLRIRELEARLDRHEALLKGRSLSGLPAHDPTGPIPED